MELNDTLLDRLDSENLSMLVVAGPAELYRTVSTGVKPLIELVGRFPGGLYGATVADRIVGGCAARIFVHLRVARVLGLQGSQGAAAILDDARVPWRFRETVPEIRNRSGDGVCPFELLSRENPNPNALIPAIRARLAQLAARQ